MRRVLRRATSSLAARSRRRLRRRDELLDCVEGPVDVVVVVE